MYTWNHPSSLMTMTFLLSQATGFWFPYKYISLPPQQISLLEAQTWQLCVEVVGVVEVDERKNAEKEEKSLRTQPKCQLLGVIKSIGLL